MKLIWTEDAEADLDRIVRHIARDNVTAALRVDDRVRQAALRLVHLPRSGRTGGKPGTFELVVPRLPYILVYEIEGDEIGIARVLHGRQQWLPAQ